MSDDVVSCDACASAAGNLVNINVRTVTKLVLGSFSGNPIVTSCSDYNWVSL